MTASVLKQDPNTRKVHKNAIYWDKNRWCLWILNQTLQINNAPCSLVTMKNVSCNQASQNHSSERWNQRLKSSRIPPINAVSYSKFESLEEHSYSQVSDPWHSIKNCPEQWAERVFRFFKRYASKKKKKNLLRKRETTQCYNARLNQPRPDIAAHMHRHTARAHTKNTTTKTNCE